MMTMTAPCRLDERSAMKKFKKLLGAVCVLASVLLVLEGCSSGYASYPQDTNSGASGVQVYGEVDAGVYHGSR